MGAEVTVESITVILLGSTMEAAPLALSKVPLSLEEI